MPKQWPYIPHLHCDDYPLPNSLNIIFKLMTSMYVFLGHRRVWGFGYGFGAAWFSVIFLFMSLVLLICDRESEEIFYKEREMDEEEGGGEGGDD